MRPRSSAERRETGLGKGDRMFGAESVERIQVILEAVVGKFKQQMDSAKASMNGLRTNMTGLGTSMKMPLQSFRAMYPNMEKVNNAGYQLGMRFRWMTHGLRGFRMEMLGVMFFGMGMQRMFLGFLQPVMEAYGVFDLFRIMLLMLFLPIMEQLFPILLSIMEWFMNLPEPVKMAIGVLVLIGVVLGTLLFLFGTLALGLGSIVQAIPVLIALFSGLGIGIGAIAAPIILIAALVAAFLLAFSIAWKNNFMDIQHWVEIFWTGITNMFKGAMDIIMGIVDLFTALFEGDLDKVMAAVQRIFSGITNLFFGFFQTIGALIITIGLTIGQMIFGIVNVLSEAGKRLWEWLNNIFGGLPQKLLDWGISMIQGLANGIASMGNVIKNAILGIFPQWARDMIWNAGKFVIDIFQNVVNAVTGGGGKKVGDFVWRPGESPVSVSPDDTLVGFKGNSPFGGGETIIHQENNYYGFTIDELKREIDNNNRNLVNDIQRLVKT